MVFGGVEYVLTNLAHPPHSCVARDSSLYSCQGVGFIDPYRESTSLPKACLVSSKHRKFAPKTRTSAHLRRIPARMLASGCSTSYVRPSRSWNG